MAYNELNSTNKNIELTSQESNQSLISSAIGLDAVSTISQPADITYFVGQTGYTITWDVNGNGRNNFYVFKNGSVTQSGTWNSKATISEVVDNLVIGLYNYTLYVNASNGSFLKDLVYVKVLENVMFLSTPSNFTYSFNTNGHYLEWIAVDNNPTTYTIYRNNVKLSYGGAWASNQTFGINIDGLAIGIYNFTIVIYDQDLNNNTNTVFVTVSSFPVFTYSLNEKVITNSSIGNYLNWNITDDNPDAYVIFRDNTDVANGYWTSSIPVSINVDGLQIGSYNYTIKVNDTDGHVTTSMTILIVDEKPIFDLVPSNNINIDESENYSLTWHGYDRNPHNYQIQVNNSILEEEDWNNNLILLNVTNFSYGVYNLTILLIDDNGISNSNSVILTVLDVIKPKIISDLVNTDFSYNSSIIDLSWQFFDKYPLKYSIYIDHKEEISNLWVNNILYDFPFRSIKDYNLTIVVYDQSLNKFNEQYTISIIDNIKPIIVTEPMNTTFEYGQFDNSLSWLLFDNYPNVYSILINGENVKSNVNWANNTFIIFSLSSYEIGTYNITLCALDSSNNTMNKSYIIHIVPIYTNLPNLNISKTIYEGETYSLPGFWTTKDDNYGIPGAKIITYLNSQKKDSYITNLNGEFNLSLDYSNLVEGNYQWNITFEKLNYQFQQVLLNFTLYWEQINIQLNMSQKLYQGKPYLISLTAATVSNFDFLRLMLDSSQSRNALSNIKFVFDIKFQLLDSSTVSKQYNLETDSSGQGKVILDSKTTSNIKSLKSINIKLGAGEYLKFNEYIIPIKSLPEIIPSDIFKWVELNFNITFEWLIFIIVIVSLFPAYFGVRKLFDIVIYFISIESSADLKEMSDFISIWLYNKDGFPFFDLQLTKEENIDPTLFAGLSSAIGIFLEEFGPKNTKGFRSFEKEGLAITMHLEDLTTLSIISKSDLSKKLKDKIKKIHIYLENEFRDEIIRNSSHLTNIDYNQVKKIFDENGIPLSFIEGQRFNLNETKSICSQKKFPFLLRRNMNKILNRIDVSVDGKLFTYQSFVNYLIKLNLNEQIASKLAFEIFMCGGFQ